MRMSRIWFLFLSLATFQIGSVVSHFGIQSGPEPVSASGTSGSVVSWAGDMVYNDLENRLYIMGSSSGEFWGDSNSTQPQDDLFRCFVASLDLPLDETQDDAVQFVQRTSFGKTNASESCFAMTYTESKVFLAGNSRSTDGGLLSPLKPPGGTIRPHLFGTILDVDLFQQPQEPDIDGTDEDPSGDLIEKFTLQGGSLMRLGTVHYPVSIVTDASQTSVYTATLVSDDKTENPNYDPNHPQVLSYPYGSSFRVYVEQFTFGATQPGGTLQPTLESQWVLPIGSAIQESVYVGGLAFAGSRLYLAGTTSGDSLVFPDDTGRVDEDGFIVEIDAALGSLTGRKIRLESQAGQNDRILGVCQQEGEQNEFFVVGTTTGSLSSDDGGVGKEKAFWAKIELQTFEVSWTRALDAVSGPLLEGDGQPSLVGVACAVTSDGSALFVAARAPSGAVVNRAGHQSYGGTDVVVISARADSGAVLFARQIGTSGDDIVTSLATDDEGNALVYGSTSGSLMRLKSADESPSSNMDVFMFSMALEDGEYKIPAEQQDSGQNPTPTDPPGGSSPTDAPDDTVLETVPPGGSPTFIDDLPPSPFGDTTDESNSGDKKNGGLIAAVVLLAGAIGIAIFAARRRSINNRKLYYPADSDHIVEYLKGFDDVEVDLKHSATGGWHGTYMNYPVNNRRGFPGSSDVTVDRMSNTVVQDTLFMDDYDTPSLGGSGASSPVDSFVIGGLDDGDEGEYDEREGLTSSLGQGERRGSRGNYDGLVDAYNSTWQDRSSGRVGDGLDGRRPRGERTSSSLLGSTDDVWGHDII